ncbi:murein hydrolase activator EnvC family protein [Bacteroidota bacterium]
MINTHHVAKEFIMALIMMFCFLNIGAQERKELEEKKIKAQNEIEYTNKLLTETQKSRKNSLQRLRLLDKRIQLRNEIIRNINQDIIIIDKDIEQKNELINEMGEDLKRIREQYAELIVHAYWNKQKRDKLMFILSSEHFNQAYRRMRYIQQYSEHRKEQAILIQEMQKGIVQEIERLEKVKIEKEALVLEKRNENHSLAREKQNKSKMVTELSKKEKDLKNEISRKKEDCRKT